MQISQHGKINLCQHSGCWRNFFFFRISFVLFSIFSLAFYFHSKIFRASENKRKRLNVTYSNRSWIEHFRGIFEDLVSSLQCYRRRRTRRVNRLLGKSILFLARARKWWRQICVPTDYMSQLTVTEKTSERHSRSSRVYRKHKSFGEYRFCWLACRVACAFAEPSSQPASHRASKKRQKNDTKHTG